MCAVTSAVSFATPLPRSLRNYPFVYSWLPSDCLPPKRLVWRLCLMCGNSSTMPPRRQNNGSMIMMKAETKLMFVDIQVSDSKQNCSISCTVGGVLDRLWKLRKDFEFNIDIAPSFHHTFATTQNYLIAPPSIFRYARPVHCDIAQSIARFGPPL